jgi:hypothetical protein
MSEVARRILESPRRKSFILPKPNADRIRRLDVFDLEAAAQKTIRPRTGVI